MASYYLAPALDRLRSEVNGHWASRSKAVDGWVGDTSHRARKSDHNPDWGDGGIVRAIDITNDGIDVDWLIAWVINDPRTKYLISRSLIWQNPSVYARGGWLPYEGDNPHNRHVHVSVRSGSYQSDQRAWLAAPTPNPSPAPEPEEDEEDELLNIAKIKGTNGVHVGNGVVRRLIPNETALADLQYKIRTGAFKGNPDIQEVTDLEWLGVLVK